jgi:hypothetical protein
MGYIYLSTWFGERNNESVSVRGIVINEHLQCRKWPSTRDEKDVPGTIDGMLLPHTVVPYFIIDSY